MKLIIQIPCLDEEETLPITFKDLPQQIEGIDQIEILLIDDGSRDKTLEIARDLGIDHIVRHTVNRGLAAAFKSGLDACLKQGADIIVNTDADNQYPGQSIPALIQPILDQKADIVIGNRQTGNIEHFSRLKKFLQWMGSAVIRYVSNTNVPDAPSGFRAFSREAALRINIVTNYTYTLETIIQAGKKDLKVVSVPIATNPQTRQSRLVRSNFSYVQRSIGAILRLFLLYEPLRTFSMVSVPFFLLGFTLWGRFLIVLLLGESERGSNTQSLLVGAVAIISGILIFIMGLLGEILSINRYLQEETLYHLKRIQFENDSSHDQQ